jgi:hypothetical protein
MPTVHPYDYFGMHSGLVSFTGVVAIALLNSLIIIPTNLVCFGLKYDLHMQALFPWQEAFPVLNRFAPHLYGIQPPMPLETIPYWLLSPTTCLLHDTPRGPNESEPNKVDHVHASRSLPTRRTACTAPSPPLPDIACTSASATPPFFSPALLILVIKGPNLTLVDHISQNPCDRVI